MGVEQHGGARTKAAAHHQVGNALQASGLDHGAGNHMLLYVKAKALQQRRSVFCVGGVVARRRVGGHAHQCLQKGHLVVKVGVDPGVELLVGVHGGWFNRMAAVPDHQAVG